ncbi:MAG: hypothetical protein U5N26_06995 [Candidatus Marinimicrobia bacterium]|nr:hypothetical protein [Candidatus Neomarinimicrobiota bacterium]
MSLDKAKVLNGPFNITATADTTEVFGYTGLKKDTLSLSTEDHAEELEDRKTDLIGRTLTAELTISELDTADLGSINDEIDNIEITFPNKSKKITIATPDEVRPSIEGGKTKITVKKFSAGDTWPFVVEDVV